MRVYISVDMEGVAGIATGDQTNRGGYGYPRAQELMTGEANAAIAGAFDAGAESVTLSDSHGTMDNILHEALDPRARLVFGTPRAQCMAHGLTADFDLALFVGYHAAAGEPGVLSHTFSSLFAGYRVNGQPASEAEVNALYAASLGVPVGLVSGDESICSVARERLPGAVVVPVKRSVGWTAADSLHPQAARAAVREGAVAAVRGAGTVNPVSLPQRFTLEVRMQVPTAAEMAALVPGAEQVDAFTVHREVDSPRDLIALTCVWYDLANSAMRARAAATNLLGRT